MGLSQVRLFAFPTGRRFDPRDLGTALAVWRTDHTADLLVKALDNPRSPPGLVEAAMAFAAAAPDKRLVFPVVRWINTSAGDKCVECLTAMGPVAEPELLKIARLDDGVAQSNAAKVLAKVGTAKSLAALTAMSKQTKYPAAAEAATLALVELKARVAAAATTQPAR